MASASACAGVSGGVRGLASSPPAASSAPGSGGGGPPPAASPQPPAGARAQPAAAPRQPLAELAQSRHHVLDRGVARLRELAHRHRLGREEEQRLDDPRQLAHATRSATGAIVISPNGSSWLQVASPCL